MQLRKDIILSMNPFGRFALEYYPLPAAIENHWNPTNTVTVWTRPKLNPLTWTFDQTKAMPDPANPIQSSVGQFNRWWMRLPTGESGYFNTSA